MSHYSVCKTKITRKGTLIKALQTIDNGKWANAVEVYDVADNLVGYQGDKRKDKANLIIRRKNVGSSSNDIGFVLAEDGTYQAIISDYDSGRHNAAWLDKLNQTYAVETVKEIATDMGYAMESRVEGGEIYITCTGEF